MASNTTFIEVKDRGWLNGFEPLWRKENQSWWGKWSWLVKILVWTAIIDGMLAIVAFEDEQNALMIYFIFAAIVPACALIIFGHETILDERKMGTAAWVLSKPVSRAAFLLSKLSADALGVLVTMVLVPGLVAYFIYNAASGIWLSIPGFLAGLGLVYLFLIFYQALVLMLSTLFYSRGPVIAIPLVIISCSYLAILVPGLGNILPSSLILSLGMDQPSLAEALAQSAPLQTVMPILATVLLVILFIIVAIMRFEREEF